MRGLDTGAPKPRKQSDLPQRDDLIETDQEFRQLPHSGSRAENP